MFGDLNERAISLEEVREAVNEIRSGKAPGLDGFLVECLKKGGMEVLEWLVRLLNLSFDMGVVPMDWRGACIVPLYKGKGDKCECSNSRGISLLSVVGKLFCRVSYPEWPHRQVTPLCNLPGVTKVARSHLSQCSKSCYLQPALNCAIRGAQGVLPCVGWGVRPVNWIYRL